MERNFDGTIVSLVRGDITLQEADGIVNAANSSLAGGGGVDGAIHRRGGPSIMEECRKVGSCPTGEAVITGAGLLKARYVIHTVGPVYKDGRSGEEELLESAYRNSLSLALKNGLKSIVFPSISTGVYGYPIKEAARVALRTVVKFIREDSGIEFVGFVLFSDKDLSVYEEALRELSA